MSKQQEKMDILLSNIKSELPKLEKLLAKVCNEWVYEDLMYRYYHHSFKVYYVQEYTQEIVKVLQELMPDEPLNKMFEKVIKDGVGKVFEMSHNKEWEKHTRPMLEAFFHTKYMLEMAIKYGKELETAPNSLPSGWAALLYLWNMR